MRQNRKKATTNSGVIGIYFGNKKNGLGWNPFSDFNQAHLVLNPLLPQGSGRYAIIGQDELPALEPSMGPRMQAYPGYRRSAARPAWCKPKHNKNLSWIS